MQSVPWGKDVQSGTLPQIVEMAKAGKVQFFMKFSAHDFAGEQSALLQQ